LKQGDKVFQEKKSGAAGKRPKLQACLRAKARGVKFGRSKSLTIEQIAELQNRQLQGTLIKMLMKDYHISKATVILRACRFGGICKKPPIHLVVIHGK
jgi:DNA invertase Pin-like site-specific DNA recombinase